MSDIAFQPQEQALENFFSQSETIQAVELELDQRELDALIAAWAQESAIPAPVEPAQQELDPQELERWLDSLDPSLAPDLDR